MHIRRFYENNLETMKTPCDCLENGLKLIACPARA